MSFDVHRIELGSPDFEGTNNAYVVSAGGAAAVIDTCVATDANREALDSGIEDADVGRVESVLLTHWHPDHSGLAGELQASHGATVYVHERDAPLVRQDDGAIGALNRAVTDRLEAWGVPEAERTAVLEFFDGNRERVGREPGVETVSDGDAVCVGRDRLEVVHTPGHTAGHCAFAFETGSTREAFAGDAVLPTYTPNVGGADVRLDRPLGRYIESLERIAGRGFDRLRPGHRGAIDGPSDRIVAIRRHHRERAGRILGYLESDGPVDPWEVSAHLFGDLSGVHVLHGPGEAFAHLDHLERAGVLDREDGRYRIRPDGRPVDHAF